jgi:hypothetical protein
MGEAGRRNAVVGKDSGRSRAVAAVARQVGFGFLRHPERAALLHKNPAALLALDSLAVHAHPLGRLQFLMTQRAHREQGRPNFREVNLGAGASLDFTSLAALPKP